MLIFDIYDRKISGLRFISALLHNDIGQVVHSLVPQSLSSVIWYRCRNWSSNGTLLKTWVYHQHQLGNPNRRDFLQTRVWRPLTEVTNSIYFRLIKCQWKHAQHTWLSLLVARNNAVSVICLKLSDFRQTKSTRSLRRRIVTRYRISRWSLACWKCCCIRRLCCQRWRWWWPSRKPLKTQRHRLVVNHQHYNDVIPLSHQPSQARWRRSLLDEVRCVPVFSYLKKGA